MIASKPRHGFTLLETILAVGLSALLIGLLGAGMRIYTQTVAQRRADVVNAQVARVILQHIANDLRGAYAALEESGSQSADISIDEDSTDEESDLGTAEIDSETASEAPADLSVGSVQSAPGLVGNQTQIQIDVLGRFAEPVKFDMITGMGIDAQMANLLSDPKVITYFLRPIDAAELAGTPLQSLGGSGEATVLVRQVTGRAEAALASSAGTVTDQSGQQLLSDQVLSIRFLYHDGFDWVDSWDSTATSTLPVAVNISIELATGGQNDATDTSTPSETYQQSVFLPMAELPDTMSEGI